MPDTVTDRQHSGALIATDPILQGSTDDAISTKEKLSVPHPGLSHKMLRILCTIFYHALSLALLTIPLYTLPALHLLQVCGLCSKDYTPGIIRASWEFCNHNDSITWDATVRGWKSISSHAVTAVMQPIRTIRRLENLAAVIERHPYLLMDHAVEQQHEGETAKRLATPTVFLGSGCGTLEVLRAASASQVYEAALVNERVSPDHMIAAFVNRKRTYSDSAIQRLCTSDREPVPRLCLVRRCAADADIDRPIRLTPRRPSSGCRSSSIQITPEEITGKVKAADEVSQRSAKTRGCVEALGLSAMNKNGNSRDCRERENANLQDTVSTKHAAALPLHSSPNLNTNEMKNIFVVPRCGACGLGSSRQYENDRSVDTASMLSSSPELALKTVVKARPSGLPRKIVSTQKATN